MKIVLTYIMQGVSPVAGDQPSRAPGALLPAAPMSALLPPNKPPSKLYVLTEALRLLGFAAEAAPCLWDNLHACRATVSELTTYAGHMDMACKLHAVE